MRIEPTVVDIPVDEVTLLEDRAHVVRRGTVELSKGLNRVRIEAIAPVACDKTLAATIVEGDARVVDARIRRRTVVRLPDEVDDAESEVNRLKRERDALDTRIDAVTAARDGARSAAVVLARVAVQTHADMADDVSWGRVGGEWGLRLDDLRTQERDALERVRAGEREIRDLQRERSDLSGRIQVMRTPAEEARADLEVDLVADGAGACRLRVDYVVPGACWRPYHTARLVAGKTPRVEWSTDACVWQNTGEDWPAAQLLLSTERASLGVEPPRLASDVLRRQRKSDTIVVEARDQTVDTAGLGVAASAGAPELPGIDDGGEVIALRAIERATVPSDGRPWRVRVSSFETDADLDRVAYPELTPCVLLRSKLANRGSAPLLAGPVDLIRDSGLVGRTSVLFVAPGERFELGWGPEADLRVKRETEMGDDESRALSSWVSRLHKVTVRLSNLGGTPREVTVTERVPISEIEKVKVELDVDVTTRRARPDENGFVTWTVELPERGRDKLVLAYTLKRHDSVMGI